jgi:DNA-directed RNA polymerase specialized sigma24 family protein
MTELQRHEEIMDVLRTLLKIQALSAVKGLPSKKEKILFLSEAGLSPKEIGLIVGSSGATVSQVIYEAKKKAKGGTHGEG